MIGPWRVKTSLGELVLPISKIPNLIVNRRRKDFHIEISEPISVTESWTEEDWKNMNESDYGMPNDTILGEIHGKANFNPSFVKEVKRAVRRIAPANSKIESNYFYFRPKQAMKRGHLWVVEVLSSDGLDKLLTVRIEQEIAKKKK